MDMKLELGKLILTALVVSTILLDSAEGEDVVLTINSSCSYNIYHPNKHSSYIIQWEGENPGVFGCKLGFRGSGEEENTYKVCVEALDFFIQGPGIILRYETGKESERTEKIFTEYSDLPEAFCAEENEFLRVGVRTTNDDHSLDTVDTSKSYFTLNITAELIHTSKEEQNQHTEQSDYAVMAVIVCLPVVCMILTICGLRTRRRDRQRRRQREAKTVQGEETNEDMQQISTRLVPREYNKGQTADECSHNLKPISYSKILNYDGDVNHKNSTLSSGAYIPSSTLQGYHVDITEDTAKMEDMPPPSYSEVMKSYNHSS